jgi:hypothetical protein
VVVVDEKIFVAFEKRFKIGERICCDLREVSKKFPSFFDANVGFGNATF